MFILKGMATSTIIICYFFFGYDCFGHTTCNGDHPDYDVLPAWNMLMTSCFRNVMKLGPNVSLKIAEQVFRPTHFVQTNKFGSVKTITLWIYFVCLLSFNMLASTKVIVVTGVIVWL